MIKISSLLKTKMVSCFNLQSAIVHYPTIQWKPMFIGNGSGL